MLSRIQAYVRQNHLALLALVVAVVGVPTAWALARNSVGPRQIKPNAVRSSDVKNEALKGLDLNESTFGQVPSAQNAEHANSADSATSAQTANAVAPNSVTGAGVLDGSLNGADIDESTLGAPTGGLEIVTASSPNDSSSPKFATAECPVGKRYFTGGFDLSGGKTGAAPDELTDVVVDMFAPNADGRRIIMSAYEEDPHAGNWQLTALAYCINAP